jgi:phosphomannomutase
VGRDARLSSPQFMDDTVGVLAAAGLEVRTWEGETPTPVVAFGALELDACAAIVVTASHNPPQDNGYKVYDRNGAQIVPPVEGAVVARIEQVGPANEVPHDLGSPLISSIDRSVYHRYLAEVEALRVNKGPQADLRIVYTPMHGVGWQSVQAALQGAGYDDVHPVPEQVEPDGRFPTVAFPNPEEPGALDLSISLAERIGADIILANDPDADRLAVAVPDGAVWVALTGNQIGVILADHLLAHASLDATPVVINSIVSSPMLGDIAVGYGARFETTLSGFKWIANAAMDIEEAGGGAFLFGYEEALGYTVGPLVRDKDGVSAAVAFADVARDCKIAAVTVLDRLADIYTRFGFWVSTQRSIVRPGSAGKAEIDAAMHRLIGQRPTTLGGRDVSAVVDYRVNAELRPRWLPASALVAVTLDGGARVLARPSGTEPKLKVYVDARAPVPHGSDPFDLEDELMAFAHEASADMMRFLDLEDDE